MDFCMKNDQIVCLLSWWTFTDSISALYVMIMNDDTSLSLGGWTMASCVTSHRGSSATGPTRTPTPKPWPSSWCSRSRTSSTSPSSDPPSWEPAGRSLSPWAHSVFDCDIYVCCHEAWLTSSHRCSLMLINMFWNDFRTRCLDPVLITCQWNEWK